MLLQGAAFLFRFFLQGTLFNQLLKSISKPGFLLTRAADAVCFSLLPALSAFQSWDKPSAAGGSNPSPSLRWSLGDVSLGGDMGWQRWLQEQPETAMGSGLSSSPGELPSPWHCQVCSSPFAEVARSVQSIRLSKVDQIFLP